MLWDRLVLGDHAITESARLLIRDYGRMALAEARRRANLAEDRGDLSGRNNWRRIITSIHELREMEATCLGR